jgi:hypothetical protein
MDHFKELYSSTLTRIGLGCVAIATTVANIPYAADMVFDLEKAIVVAVAIATWLGSEIMSFKPTPHQHDIDLRNKLRSLMEPYLHFLLNHNFEGSFHRRDLQGIHKISTDWVGVTYQFQDRAIQARWVPIREKIAELSSHVASNSHFLDRSVEWIDFKNEDDKEHVIGLTKRTYQNMEKANRLASEIYRELESLEALCLKRLGAVSLQERQEEQESSIEGLNQGT